VKVSSATVRNDMAVLEAEGYLTQPHTSAGRVPTEKGYRYFVDHLGQAELSGGDRRRVADFFTHMRGEIEGMMQETAKLLTSMTNYAALVVDDSDDAADVRSVQLVGLSERVALAVVVLASGQVSKHTIELPTPISDEVLAEANTMLRAAFEGRSLAVAHAVPAAGSAEAVGVARVVHAAVTGTDRDAGRVYVDGTSRVVGAFEAVESVSRVLTILEQQLLVVSLLADVVDRGLTVAIGSETGVAPLAECSLVVSPYEIDGEHAGSIAVLGPTRMNYQQALSAVAAVSHQLGTRLSEG
jgi:heat-inducible transcriptional repressor